MLLTEKMKTYSFSSTEKELIDFILEKEELILEYTTMEIAEKTYTSPSLLVRIAKKLGYGGWKEFQREYVKEIKYIKEHFQDIDANIPFQAKDNFSSIAGKITKLAIESAEDTFSLLDLDALKRAVALLEKSSEVRVFAVGEMNYLGEEFVLQLNRIHKRAFINGMQDVMFHDSLMMTKDQCAICISYSGETPTLLKVVDYLKMNHIPIIAITSLGDNRLSERADITLRVSTREKSYSKIANFTSRSSISLILDILYSCFFRQNYEKNLAYKRKIAKEVESNRLITNKILEENG